MYGRDWKTEIQFFDPYVCKLSPLTVELVNHTPVLVKNLWLCIYPKLATKNVAQQFTNDYICTYYNKKWHFKKIIKWCFGFLEKFVLIWNYKS